jgi:hypothetical protein
MQAAVLRRPCPGVCLVLARSSIWALNSLTRSDRGFVGAAISAVGMHFLVAVVVAAGQGSAGLAAAAAGGCMQAQFVWAWWLSKLALGWVVKASYVWATLTEGSSSSQRSFACAPVAYLHLKQPQFQCCIQMLGAALHGIRAGQMSSGTTDPLLQFVPSRVLAAAACLWLPPREPLPTVDPPE